MKKTQLLFALFLCLLIFTSCSKASLEEATTFFEKHENALSVVTQYLASYDYENILITKANGTMSLLLDEDVKIDDDDVDKAIKDLFSAGCYLISKRADDNRISYTIWSRFMDFGAGIHYSLDGVTPPTEQYLTKQESLGVDRWYYFEEDYNEWRLSNST